MRTDVQARNCSARLASGTGHGYQRTKIVGPFREDRRLVTQGDSDGPLVRVAAWTGPWTAARGTPSAACALMVSTRGIIAGQAHVATERASHNLPVAGSSPPAPPAPALPAVSVHRSCPLDGSGCNWVACHVRPSGLIEQLPSGSWPAKVYAGKRPADRLRDPLLEDPVPRASSAGARSGRVLQPDRRLLHGRPDDRRSGRLGSANASALRCPAG